VPAAYSGRAQPEVAGQPDAGKPLEAQRLDQVARGLGARQRCGRGRHEATRPEHRCREHREQAAAPDSASKRPDGTHANHQQCQCASQGRDEPDHAAAAEHPDERRAHERQWGQRARLPLALNREDRERHDRGQQRRGGDLLDPSPQVVAVEQCRLGADERRDGAKGPRLEQRPGHLPQAEGNQRPERRHVRLDRPGHVLPAERARDPERKKGADWIALAEVEVQRRFVRGRVEAVEAPARLHDPIRECHPGRCVVELDVTGEGRFSGEHDRSRQSAECGQGGDRRPELKPAEQIPAAQHQAGDAHQERERNDQAGAPLGHGQELTADDDQGEPDRRQERTRHASARDAFDEHPGAGCQGEQQRREQAPGPDHRPRSSA
jgi:hypothetical protein